MKYVRALGPLAAFLLVTGFSHAQTIDVPIDPIYASSGLGSGGGAPYIATDTSSPVGKQVTDIQPVSYFEYVVAAGTGVSPTESANRALKIAAGLVPASASDMASLNVVNTGASKNVIDVADAVALLRAPSGPPAGLYTVSINWEMPGGDPDVTFAFETRPLSTDPFITRYATPDSATLPRVATWTGLQVINDPNGQPLTVPLQAGQNVLRIQNVARRHNPAFSYPPDLTDPNDRPVMTAQWSDLRVAQIQLTRVGDLPPAGTITGTVTGTQPLSLPNIPVAYALVTANPPGGSQTELTNWWKNGYYTYSKPDGTYTLQAPAGSQELMAGRPSNYELPGSPKVNVTVPSGSSVSASPLSLTTLWANDPASGSLRAVVESEYFDSKSGNVALVPQDGGENGYKMGWIDFADTTSAWVDVPQTGYYKVTSSYTNGDVQGAYRVGSSLGGYVLGMQPNSGGWPVRNVVDYTENGQPSKLYLQKGLNLISQTNEAGSSDMDAVYLTLLPDAPTTGLVHGTLTDPATGKPVANAVVSSGSNAVYTDANGQFALALPTGSQTITISGGNAAGAPYIDETTVPVTITAGGVTEVTPAISVRPSIDLTTANGFAWKALPNTGGSMDLAGALAAEGSAVDMPVPSSWRTSIPNNNIDQQYGWAILHFTVPADLASQLANRTGIFKSNGIDDVDATYLNGTLIGSTGSFPSTPLPAQAAGYTAPGPNLDLPGGAVVAWNAPRYYTFPASLLNTTGDNVLAIRIYDNTGGGGVTNTPTLVLGPPSVTVSGTVTAGGSPLANVRVAAMDAQGIASDYTMTGADGTYTLRPAAGQVIIGVAIPKYAATSKDLGVLAAGATAAGTNFSLTAIPGGAYAPIYDDFSATSSADPKYYTNLWDPLTELNPQTPTPPLVTEPGFDVNTSNPIPNSITVDSAANERGGILSKARFSKFASVNAARLVSAKPFGSGGAQPNMIFQLYTWQENDPTRSVYRGYVELDAEGYAQINGDQRLQMRMFVDGKGQLGSAAGPAGIPTPDTISPTNPLDFVITRTGTVMDFYVNGQHLLGSNDLSIAGYGPLARMIGAPQKLFPYSFDRTGQITWGSVQAGPVAP